MTVFLAEGDDLFASKHTALINPVNTVGVMGAGLSREFRRRWPGMMADYVRRCQRGAFKIGEPYIYRTSTRPIVLFPTKRHWKDPSRLDDVEAGLVQLTAVCVNEGVYSVAMPALGCGLGGLDWDDVRATIFKNMGNSPVAVELFPPGPPATGGPRGKA